MTTDACPASQDEYEIWIASQRRARTFGRATTAIGVLGGLAVGHVLAPPGYGLLFQLALAVLWGLVTGRAVEHIMLGYTGAAPRPGTGLLALGALGLGVLAMAGLYQYFAVELARVAATDYFQRDRSDEWELAILIAVVSGAGAFFLITKGPDPEIFNDDGPASEAGRAVGGGHSVAVARARLAVGAGVVALLVGLPFGAGFAADWRGLQPVAVGLVLSLAGWWIAAPQVSNRARRAAAAEEVKEELAAIRRENARVWFGRFTALASGLGVVAVGLYILDAAGDRASRGVRGYDRFDGMQYGFWVLVVGVLVALAVQKAFERPMEMATSSAAVTGGVFDESIQHTGSIEVRQKLTLMSVLFGSLSRDQYEMIDGGQAFCGHAGERSGWLSRLFLGGRRAINLVVDDLGRDALHLRRGFLWLPFFNRATVHEGQRAVGRIDQRLSIVRRYTLRGADGAERYELVSGLIFRSRFKVLQGGVEVGELRRVRRPWYIRLFTPFWMKQDRFSLRFPQGSGMDDRRLLIGSLFLVDITHYPTQSTLRWGALLVLLMALIPGESGQVDTDLVHEGRGSEHLLR